jgi:hypothetical protein
MRCGSCSAPATGWCAAALALLDYQSDSQQDGQLSLQGRCVNGETRRLQGHGNGLLSAAASGLSAAKATVRD